MDRRSSGLKDSYFFEYKGNLKSKATLNPCLLMTIKLHNVLSDNAPLRKGPHLGVRNLSPNHAIQFVMKLRPKFFPGEDERRVHFRPEPKPGIQQALEK